MKKAWVIIFIVVLSIGWLFVFISYDQSNQDPTYRSVEGFLKNGRKYKFYGTDTNNFDLKKFREEKGLTVEVSNYTLTETARTPEEAAEKSQTYIALDTVDSKEANIEVFYDKETDEWIIDIVWSEGHLYVGGYSVFSINRNNGILKNYSTPWK